jgi:hypothetical protein
VRVVMMAVMGMSQHRSLKKIMQLLWFVKDQLLSTLGIISIQQI